MLIVYSWAQAADYEPACECYALAEAEMDKMGTKPSDDNVATFYFNYGRASQGLGSYTRALTLFTAVLEAAPQHERALDHRAECHAALYDYEAAIADLADLLKEFKSSAEAATVQSWNSRTASARAELRRAPRDVLGVPATANEAEVRKAYRSLCLTWHPDKHAASSDDTKTRAKHRFERIQAAYEKLTASTAARGRNFAWSASWE